MAKNQHSRWLVTFSLGGERWTVGVSAKTREQARQLAWEDARDFAGADYPRVVCCSVQWEGREE